MEERQAFRNRCELVKGWAETCAHRSKPIEADIIITFTKPGLYCSIKDNMLVICKLMGCPVSGGEICSLNSPPSQISQRLFGARKKSFSAGSVSHDAALPPHGRQWNSRRVNHSYWTQLSYLNCSSTFCVFFSFYKLIRNVYILIPDSFNRWELDY